MSQCFLYNNCNHKDCDKPMCMRRYKLETLYTMAMLQEGQFTKKQLVVDADGTDLEEFKTLASIEANIVDFVYDTAHNNIFLYSNICGNGKSSWARRLVQAFLNKIWPTSVLAPRALFVSVPHFLDSAKRNITAYDKDYNHIISSIYNADLVVFDDIGTKTGSEFDINKLEEIIDYRMNCGKANIFTTNIAPNRLIEVLGARITSRIYNGSAYNIEFKGRDKRTINF